MKKKSIKEKISCIIPAYNEGKRILNVVKPISNVELVSEIIIVNDGSIDDTEKIIRGLIKKNKKIKLINHKFNQGKAKAIKTGIDTSRYSIISFFDADLINLKTKNVYDLIMPIIKNKADMTLSLRSSKIPFNPWLFFMWLPSIAIDAINNFLGVNPFAGGTSIQEIIY